MSLESIADDDDVVELNGEFDRALLVKTLTSRTPDRFVDRLKPYGLWYAKGTTWIEWCEDSRFREMSEKYIYKLKIDKRDVLKVTNERELKIFGARFEDSGRVGWGRMGCDWAGVARIYAGVEFSPYLYKSRYEHLWYSTLDVPSGCVWEPSVVLEVELVRPPKV